MRVGLLGKRLPHGDVAALLVCWTRRARFGFQENLCTARSPVTRERYCNFNNEP